MTDTLWHKGGGRLDEQVEAFTVGNDNIIDAHILADDCWASIAHAAALVRAGILKPDELARVQQVLLELIEHHEREGVPIRRSQEDCHTAIEQALTERLGDLGKKIHTARSRNDQVLTALRLFTRRRMLEVIGTLHRLATRLLTRAEGAAKIPMRGYSHTRPAMPTTLGVFFGSFVESLLDDATLLQTAFELNDRSPLGSAAGFGSPIPLDREYSRDLLGFASLQVNALYCQNGRGKAEGAVVNALQSAQDTLAKLATDLILFSGNEFGYVVLPERLTTGSSMMPQKRNPDVLELVRARAGVVAGAASQVRSVAVGLTSGYHRDFQLLKQPVVDSLAAVCDSLAMMDRVVEDVSFDEAALAASCTPEIYAADVALEKAREGMPFRDAYRDAMEHLDEITIDVEFIAERIHAYRTIGSMGNPCLWRYRDSLSKLEDWLAQRKARLQDALTRLSRPLAS
jgi:argininosuccinate lyase